jgi:hypothetical protein
MAWIEMATGVAKNLYEIIADISIVERDRRSLVADYLEKNSSTCGM